MTGTRLTLSEWVRHPTTILLMLSVSAIAYLGSSLTNTASRQSKECLEQVVYLRDRISKLEKLHDEYVRSMLQQEIQIQRLKSEGGTK